MLHCESSARSGSYWRALSPSLLLSPFTTLCVDENLLKRACCIRQVFTVQSHGAHLRKLFLLGDCTVNLLSCGVPNLRHPSHRRRAVETVRALAAPLTAPLVATSAVGTLTTARFGLSTSVRVHALLNPAFSVLLAQRDFDWFRRFKTGNTV